MKKTFYALALAACGLSSLSSAFAQGRIVPVKIAPPRRECAAMDVLAAQLKEDPGLAQRMEAIETHTRSFQRMRTNGKPSPGTATTVTIPVVVHVVYNTTDQNISDAQVQSQIDVLNEDFNKLNSDASKVPSLFSGAVASAGVRFALARRDPNGRATNGIVRTQTKVTSWSTNDAVKSSKRGGDDAWDATQYLNLWACNLGQGLLGYAQFPGGKANTDGVVVLYSAFGSRTKDVKGTYISTYDLGRTTTHEVGHWLNLRHIWGDASCGNDYVEDTPTQQAANYGCPSFPHVTCSNQGDMSMNYMDYTDDACMYMFSNGQSARMNALFAAGGARASLLTSQGGTAPLVGSLIAKSEVTLYPNPATDVLNVALPESSLAGWNVKVYDARGYEMKQTQFSDGQLRVNQLPRGLYQLTLTKGNQAVNQRFQKD